MIDGATVTLPLGEFDELRADSKEYRNIAPKIAACFEYEVKEYGEPEKCKTCKRVDPDCTKCKVFLHQMQSPGPNCYTYFSQI